MRIACVVPRYGTEIAGGVGWHCRLVAEQLAERHQVDVVTTCAREDQSWHNEYPEGTDRLRGVTVRRFATSRARDPREFQRQSEWLFTHRHGRQEELDWVKQMGPWAPGLTEFLDRHHHQYDVLMFFGHLSAPTVVGMRAAPQKSVLVPSLLQEDQAALQLGIAHEVFAGAAAIAWSSDAERDFARLRYSLRAVAEDVIGCGVAAPEGEPVAEGAEPPAPPPEGREPFAPHIEGPANAFRRRHRMHDPFVLCGGRIDPGQGVEELLEYFQSYVRDHGDGTLVLMGVKRMPLPEDQHVRFAGTLPDEDRLHAFEAAAVVVVPSPDDDVSAVALEAFSVGTPVLVNARAAGLVDHCQRSHAGLYYADRWEFVESLRMLLRDPALRASMGRNGRAYVHEHFRWPAVIEKYERLFTAIRGTGRDRVPDRPAEPDPTRDASRGRDSRRDAGRQGHRDRGRPQNRNRDRDRGRNRDRQGRQKGR